MKILDINPFQETLAAGMCGPASLKMVLDFYGVEKTEKELAELCGTDSKLGTDEDGIKKAAESLDFKVEIKNNSTFKDIQSWLDKNTPVIVDWFSKDDGHYSVVVGLDDELIYLVDPEIGAMRKFTRDDFLKVWFDFKGEFPSREDLILCQVIAVIK